MEQPYVEAITAWSAGASRTVLEPYGSYRKGAGPMACGQVRYAGQERQHRTTDRPLRCCIQSLATGEILPGPSLDETVRTAGPMGCCEAGGHLSYRVHCQDIQERACRGNGSPSCYCLSRSYDLLRDVGPLQAHRLGPGAGFPR